MRAISIRSSDACRVVVKGPNSKATTMMKMEMTMPKLAAIVLLGRIAHDSTVKALGMKAAAAPFAHGAVHEARNFRLYDSYHCSRYNTNTGVLTPKMFRDVFAQLRKNLG